uniref:Putative glycosyltransferase n=1 Tax=viral metagenome TaxID=1070528 RepID=A0A6M3KCV1_9ZZZZ
MIDLVVVSDCKTDALYQTTLKCISSWRKYNTEGEIYVIEKQPIHFDGCISVFQPEPFNYNRCLNLGYLLSKAEYFCFANNDVEFLSPVPIEKLEKYDSISPVNTLWMHHKKVTKDIKGYGVGVYVTGWCIANKRSAMEKIGGFNDIVEFWYSDNIYALQLQKAGLIHALIADWAIKHHASQTLFSSNVDVGNLTHGQAKNYEEAIHKLLE